MLDPPIFDNLPLHSSSVTSPAAITDPLDDPMLHTTSSTAVGVPRLHSASFARVRPTPSRPPPPQTPKPTFIVYTKTFLPPPGQFLTTKRLNHNIDFYYE